MDANIAIVAVIVLVTILGVNGLFLCVSLPPPPVLADRRPSLPAVCVPTGRDPGLHLYHQRSEMERGLEGGGDQGSEVTDVDAGRKVDRPLSQASNGDMDCDHQE